MGRINRVNGDVRVASIKTVTTSPYTLTQEDDVVNVDPADTSEDFFIRIPPASMFINRMIAIRLKKNLASNKYVKGQRVDGKAIAGIFVNNIQRAATGVQVIYSNGRYWRAIS